jgi:hypothetical protein
MSSTTAIEPAAREKGGRRCLPNLIVIGGMKCGTSSLHFYLRQHPQIVMSAEKELNFFIEERNWGRGVDWYASQFRDAEVRGEVSPNYTACERFPGVPGRMHALLPDAKLIYLVRDPVERAISHWIHNYSDGRENRQFDEAIRHWSYVERSQYWRQLEAFLDFFPARQVLVVETEELRHRRRETMRRIFEFLGVDSGFQSAGFRVERHRSSLKRRKTRVGSWLAERGLERRLETLPQPWRWQLKFLLFLPFSRTIPRPVPSDSTRDWFVERVLDDIAKLRAFTGQSFPHWSI